MQFAERYARCLSHNEIEKAKLITCDGAFAEFDTNVLWWRFAKKNGEGLYAQPISTKSNLAGAPPVKVRPAALLKVVEFAGPCRPGIPGP